MDSAAVNDFINSFKLGEAEQKLLQAHGNLPTANPLTD